MTIDEKVDQIATDVAVIKNVLKGNGSEGLVSRVSKHEGFINMAKGGWAATVIFFSVLVFLVNWFM